MYSAQLPSALPEPLQPSSVLVDAPTPKPAIQSLHRHFSPTPPGDEGCETLLGYHPVAQDPRHAERQPGNEWRGWKQKPNGHRLSRERNRDNFPPSGQGGGNIPFRQIQKTPYPCPARRQTNLFPVLDSRERNPTCLNLHQTAPTESHLSSPDSVSDTFPLLPPGYVRIPRPGPGPGRLVGT